LSEVGEEENFMAFKYVCQVHQDYIRTGGITGEINGIIEVGGLVESREETKGIV
jgi:hypothetical protein